MLRDGQRITCLSDTDGAVPGDEGRVLVADEHSAHVLWTSGAARGSTSLCYAEDIASLGQVMAAEVDDLADSLDVGESLSLTGARFHYDEGGPDAVLGAMASEGHLSGFAAIAEETLGFVSAKVRADPAVREVLGQLDPDEAEEVVALAAMALVRDAFVVEA